MSTCTFVSFEASMPKDGEPPGRELAELVAEGLNQRGQDAGAPQPHEGWAWELSMTFEGGGVFALVGLSDDPPLEWQIHSYARRRRKLFGGGIGQDELEERTRAWCEALHATLSADDRIRTIRWYDAATFDRDHGATWADAPS